MNVIDMRRPPPSRTCKSRVVLKILPAGEILRVTALRRDAKESLKFRAIKQDIFVNVIECGAETEIFCGHPRVAVMRNIYQRFPLRKDPETYREK